MRVAVVTCLRGLLVMPVWTRGYPVSERPSRLAVLEPALAVRAVSREDSPGIRPRPCGSSTSRRVVAYEPSGAQVVGGTQGRRPGNATQPTAQVDPQPQVHPVTAEAIGISAEPGA